MPVTGNSRDQSADRQLLSPVTGGERVLDLDVLRGFAILGILLVNVMVFSGTWGLGPAEEYTGAPGADQILGLLVFTFAEGKFINTLAFLFGVGFTLQAMRARKCGLSSKRLLLRRMLVLGLIGIVHAVLIWSGDILLSYALLGVVLTAFFNRRAKTLLIWAVCLLGVMVLPLTVVALGLAGSGAGSAGAAGSGGVAVIEEVERSAMAAYNSGSYARMVLQRLREIALFAIAGLIMAPALLAMMLAGSAVARSGIVEHLDSQRALIRRAAVAGLGVGIPLNILYSGSLVVDPHGAGAAGVAGLVCWLVGAPTLAVGYMAALTLLVQSNFAPATLQRVAAVGRLALTNYLTQSVVMTSIFYGFSIYGRIGLIPAMSIALALLAVQLLVSPMYFRHFSHGPVEWLWRRFTYGPRKHAT